MNRDLDHAEFVVECIDNIERFTAGDPESILNNSLIENAVLKKV